MKVKHSKSGEKRGHSQNKHLRMMVICCGLPIAGFLVIGMLGISAPSLETLIALICPIGMLGMMYMMHRDNKCQHDNEAKSGDYTESKEITEISSIDNKLSLEKTTNR